MVVYSRRDGRPLNNLPNWRSIPVATSSKARATLPSGATPGVGKEATNAVTTSPNASTIPDCARTVCESNAVPRKRHSVIRRTAPRWMMSMTPVAMNKPNRHPAPPGRLVSANATTTPPIRTVIHPCVRLSASHTAKYPSSHAVTVRNIANSASPPRSSSVGTAAAQWPMSRNRLMRRSITYRPGQRPCPYRWPEPRLPQPR